jgi:hypothetical protein
MVGNKTKRNISIVLTENIGLVGSFEKIKIMTKTLSETLNISDSISKTISKVFSETNNFSVSF